MSFIAFEVHVDGELVSRAGGSDVSVLAGTLTLSRRYAKGDQRVVEVRVGGMSSPDSEGGAEHLDWVHVKDVAVGTEIRFKVVSTSDADTPSRRHLDTPKT